MSISVLPGWEGRRSKERKESGGERAKRCELRFDSSLSSFILWKEGVTHLQRNLESPMNLSCMRGCVEGDLVGVGVVGIDLDFVGGGGGHGGGFGGGREERVTNRLSSRR